MKASLPRYAEGSLFCARNICEVRRFGALRVTLNAVLDRDGSVQSARRRAPAQWRVRALHQHQNQPSVLHQRPADQEHLILRSPSPDGYKRYSKTKPMRFEDFAWQVGIDDIKPPPGRANQPRLQRAVAVIRSAAARGSGHLRPVQNHSGRRAGRRDAKPNTAQASSDELLLYADEGGQWRYGWSANPSG